MFLTGVWYPDNDLDMVRNLTWIFPENFSLLALFSAEISTCCAGARARARATARASAQLWFYLAKGSSLSFDNKPTNRKWTHMKFVISWE